MPDVLETPQTTETVETPQPSQQDINRQALYEQYYGTATPTGGDAPVVETTPAQESAAIADPVAPPAVTPTATLPPEVLQLLQTMQSELIALKSQQAPPPPAIPVTPVADAEPAWIPLLREGKIKEAEDAMAASVMAKIKDQLQDQLLQKSTDQTITRMRAEADVDRFTTELRTANPELVPMEKMIAVDAQERMNQAYKQGLVKTTDDAVRIYKASVTEAVTSARKLYHTLRGDGKQEAQTRNREVLSSQPVPPNQVDTSRQQVNTPQQEPPAQTDAEYIQRRRAVSDYQKGLAPKPNFL